MKILFIFILWILAFLGYCADDPTGICAFILICMGVAAGIRFVKWLLKD